MNNEFNVEFKKVSYQCLFCTWVQTHSTTVTVGQNVTVWNVPIVLFTTKQWAHSQREILGNDINSLLGLLHYVDVDNVADVLEHTISTFRDKVCW
jgi:hypothetical protein